MDKISPKFAKEENQKKKKNTSVAGKLARNVVRRDCHSIGASKLVRNDRWDWE